MKKAFTLIEMLVVVTVIAILVGIVVRFGNIGVDTAKRNVTISRMQRLENALSGYYAAFGSYPPVRLQGSRNIYLEVSSHGVQNGNGNERSSIWGWVDSDGKVTDKAAEVLAWEQVRAACEAQPVACYFPYSLDYRLFVESYSQAMSSYVSSLGEDVISAGRKAAFEAGFDTGVPIGRFSPYRNKTEWTEVQLFKFGLLSFLLPRYLFMMEGPEELFTDYAQWTGNNQMPCDPLRGTAYQGGWSRLRSDANGGDLARVANIPTQAVCARWIANFEKSLTCAHELTLFGVKLMVEEDEEGMMEEGTANINLHIYSPGGADNDSTSGQYVLNSVTIRDGWGNDFYYYSPAPYQSYVLWSAGTNGRTFPPWYSRDSLNADANRCVGYWTADDIVSLRQ